MSTLSPARPRAARAALFGLAVLMAFSARSGAQTGLDFDVYRERVEPIFIRARGDFLPPDPGDPACVMCHTWQTHTPLMLESLEIGEEGEVYWTEAQSRRNFEAVSRLVAPGDPAGSRLLRAPLSADAGGTPLHTGGKVWSSQDDPEWRVLAEWVNTGTRGASAATDASPEVDYEFFRACVQPIFFQVTPGGLACASCHSLEFTQTDPEVSFDAVRRLIEPGRPTQSRLLMHPLHPEGGGDYVHNGVRRWRSQDDPEWRMLAQWVNGERTGSTCL